MDLTTLKQYGLWALVSMVIYSLLNLNIFVTHGQLETELRALESVLRTEYATHRDIEDLKQSVRDMNDKLDKLNQQLRNTI